jgi:hypothetical protein
MTINIPLIDFSFHVQRIINGEIPVSWLWETMPLPILDYTGGQAGFQEKEMEGQGPYLRKKVLVCISYRE